MPGIYLQADHPRRPIEWRWQLAHIHLEGGDQQRQSHDRLVERVRRYLTAVAEGVAPGAADAVFEEAESLFVSTEADQALLRAWLLAGLSVPEVAARTGLREEVVQIFSDVFFDIGSRRKALGFICNHVLKIHSRKISSFEEAEHLTWERHRP